MKGKILIIADAEDKCSATPRGLQLAAKLGLATDVVAFTYESMGGLQVSASEKQTLRKHLLDQREKSVASLIEKFQTGDQKVSLKTVW